jgi:hypothetical protein
LSTNPFYNHAAQQPVPFSRGSSQAMRAEFDAIASGFDKVDQSIKDISASSEFRLIYQGAFATDPIQRFDGTALENGDLYFNTAAKAMKAYADGVWSVLPTSSNVLLKSGDKMTGPLEGTTALFSGEVQAAGFRGEGKNLTGFTALQITNALAYTPANKGGDTFTGAISGTNATFSGTVSGAVIKQVSDERRKKCWTKLPADVLYAVAAMKKVGLYIDRKSGEVRAGAGAQSFAEILPMLVHEDEDGLLGIEYGPAAFVLAALEIRERLRERELLSKELAKLRQEIAQLKKRAK